LYPSLTEDEARHLAGGSLLGMAATAEGSSGIKQIFRHLDKKYIDVKVASEVSKSHLYKKDSTYNELQPDRKDLYGLEVGALKESGEFLGEYDIVNKGKLDVKYSRTFSGHHYREYRLNDDIILFRAGSKEFGLGEYFSFDMPVSELQVRIDKAIKHQWDDGVKSEVDVIYKTKIPKGTVIYVGKVSTQGYNYLGGTEQVVIPKPWTIEGVEVINSYPIKK
jgi:hypothetical protein